MCSSGSTGLPKVILADRPGLFDPDAMVPLVTPWMEVERPQIVLVPTTLYHTNGFSTLQSLIAGEQHRQWTFAGSVMDTPSIYDVEELRRIGGAINYTVGPALVKAYVLAEHPDPKQRHYLNLYKMGAGPLYPFLVPDHLVHFEMPISIARVALFGATRALAGRQSSRSAPLPNGTSRRAVFDDYGMYMTYGEAANVDEMSTQQYLPKGWSRAAGWPRYPEGPGPHLRRRGAAGGPAGRPAARRAVPTLPRRDLAGGAPVGRRTRAVGGLSRPLEDGPKVAIPVSPETST